MIENPNQYCLQTSLMYESNENASTKAHLLTWLFHSWFFEMRIRNSKNPVCGFSKGGLR